MVNPVGPVFTGGFEEFVVGDEGSGEMYKILYLPDLNNNELQAEGRSQVFYWVPGTVRLAQKGDGGDYKFHHLHFVGVMDEQTTAGVEGHTEVVGGVLSFTTTSSYPAQVLKRAHDQLLAKFNGKDDRYWGIRTRVAPEFRMVPITSNSTAVTNLAPDAGGTAPAEGIATGGAAPAGGPGGPPGGSRSAPHERSMVRRATFTEPVLHGARFQPRSNLDAWAFKLQHQGPGSVTGGENAYAGMMGAYPSEIIWAGFHGAWSPLVVAQNLVMPMWSQEIYLKITGNWDRIFEHFSTAAQGRYLWFGGDVKAEFNNLRINGGIKVEVMVDGTTPQGAEQEKTIEKRIDMITEQFMKQAMKIIFEPAAPTVEPAQAPSGGIFSSIFGFGGGFALKYRRDEQHLDLHYEETRHFRYNQPNTISSSFEGFFNAMKQDPDAEKKYFTRLALGGISGKVTRLVKPVVNWPDPARSWVGEPVAFLSAQVGYPNMQGSIDWKAQLFQSTDTSASATFQPAFVKLLPGEGSNLPAGWTPDKTFVKRKVHLREAPGLTDDPFVRLIVERNEIELDPGENGTLSNDNVVEVRADSVGKLEIGPITISAVLDNNKQIVEVEFKALGKTLDGTERPIVKFSWNNVDQDTPRIYEIFTGDLAYVPLYEYRVICTERGGFGTHGRTWMGPWTSGSGNGPIMIDVPAPEDPGVVQTRLSPRAVAMAGAPPTGRPQGAPTGTAATPASHPPRGVTAPPRKTAASSGSPGSGSYGPPSSGAAKQPPSGTPSATKTARSDHDGEAGADLVEGWVVLP